ncbi:MAG TPA: AlkA N-terminal domain-containing protein [Ktedonobacterales bacterium]|nr:AlkA N-terminal domain-containing protein [Ktedonobacterales bacterium]
MELEFERCYRAIQSRDSRFDGLFVTAVTTTGIYCRPICPAQTPHARNVRFYRYPAAAEAAGFRACRRCRPEASPGSPDWNTRADLSGRALRLIAGGVADLEGVAGLARRLNVSPRHLHREMVAAVGVGPLALARTRRAQTARMLLDQTRLPMTEIAFAAGFASIRQFNETMRASFGDHPSALRRRGRPEEVSGGALVLHLSYRPPLDSGVMLGFFARRAIAGVEEVVEGRYRRTITLPRSRGVIELTPALDAARVTLRARVDDVRDVGALAARARQLFDLEADPAAIGEALSADAALAPLVAARPGLRMPGAIDGFEMAVRAIVGQQVSVAGARATLGKLVARLGSPLAALDGTLTHEFPTAEAVATGDLDGLMPQARAASLRGMARAVASGELALDPTADRDETRARLLALPGVGPWTAEYIAMRALGDPDGWPGTDLGIKQAAERLGFASLKELSARAESWRPWRSYAAQHLWASLTA